MGDKAVEELKIVEDIRHSIGTYRNIEDFDTMEEIEEGVAIINQLSREYRHLHVELKSELGNEDYSEKYPNYDDTVNRMSKFIDTARARTKVLREKAGKVDPEAGEKFAMLKVSRDVLDMKIKQVDESVDLKNVTDICDINEFISKKETFLNEYFDILGQYKFHLGQQYDDALFEDELENLSKSIKDAKDLRKKVSQENKIDEMECSSKKLEQEQILKGKNLFSEIAKRLEMLELKYDLDLSGLGDYQILEVSQDKTLDQEFNTVLEKVTDLSSLVPGGGDEVQKLLDSASAKRDSVSDKRNDFLKNLKTAVELRDVTPDKLKNASTLKIELPKFCGYSSQMDFYTFKTEFVKLVEPVVQGP